jgi:hypothetical protein
MLSTPEGYATPDQIAQAQQLSSLLMKGGHRDAPITSPWQGARMLADTLAGSNASNRAGAAQVQAGNAAASQVVPPQVPNQPTPTQGAPQAPPSGPTSPAGGGAASVRNNNPGAQWPGPTAQQFGASSSQTIGGGNQIAKFDDPVKGAAAQLALLDKKYSGMPINAAISKWSGGNSSPQYAAYIAKNTGLTPDTPITPQLLRSPEGLKLAKSMADWEAGGKYPMSDQQWTSAQALAFSGGGQQQPPVGPQMAAGGKTGAGPVAASPPPSNAGNPQMGPQYAPARQHIDEGRMRGIWSNPNIDLDTKKQFLQLYMEQYQPQKVEDIGGNQWIIPQDGKSPPYQIPKINQQQLKSGTVEAPVQSYITRDPKTGQPVQQMMPIQGGEGLFGGQGGPTSQQPSSNLSKPIDGPSLEMPPAGGSPPPSPGTPGPQGANIPMRPGAQLAMLTPPQGGQGTPSPKTPPQPSPQVVPPQGAPPQQGMPQPGAPPQGAALPSQPNAPPSGGAPPAPGMLGQKPPQPGMLSTPPPTQVAQQGGVGGLLGGLQQMDLDQERRKENIKNDQKSYSDNYNAANSSGRTATGLIPQLDLANASLKKMYTGILAPQVNNLQRLKAAIGGNPEAASAFATFQKATSEAIAESLKSSFGGLGQIRNKEIELKEKAMASVYNTPQANEVVLNVAKASAQQAQGLADVANRYNQGQRYQNGKWYQSNETPTNGGLNELLLKYAKSHPIMSGDDIDKAMKTLNGEEAAASWKEGSPEPPPQYNVK